MGNTIKKQIKAKVDWVFKTIFMFGWSTVLIGGLHLTRQPENPFLVTIVLFGLVSAVVTTFDLFNEKISSRLITYFWRKYNK